LLVIVCGGQGAYPTGATYLTVITIGHGPLKALLAPLSAASDALLGAVGGNVRWCLPVVAWGHHPTSLAGAKHDCLVTGSALVEDAAWLLERVPKEVATSTLLQALRMVLGQRALCDVPPLSKDG
jgi:hypothetical protein